MSYTKNEAACNINNEKQGSCWLSSVVVAKCREYQKASCLNFSKFMDNKTISGNYHVLELIGEGSFGKVYRGRRIYTGEVCQIHFLMQQLTAENCSIKKDVDFE